MTDGLGYIVALAGTWLSIGLGLSWVMGRRGRDRFSWFVVGTLVGPFAVVLAWDSLHHPEGHSA